MMHMAPSPPQRHPGSAWSAHPCESENLCHDPCFCVTTCRVVRGGRTIFKGILQGVLRGFFGHLSLSQACAWPCSTNVFDGATGLAPRGILGSRGERKCRAARETFVTPPFSETRSESWSQPPLRPSSRPGATPLPPGQGAGAPWRPCPSLRQGKLLNHAASLTLHQLP